MASEMHIVDCYERDEATSEGGLLVAIGVCHVQQALHQKREILKH